MEVENIYKLTLDTEYPVMLFVSDADRLGNSPYPHQVYESQYTIAIGAKYLDKVNSFNYYIFNQDNVLLTKNVHYTETADVFEVEGETYYVRGIKLISDTGVQFTNDINRSRAFSNVAYMNENELVDVKQASEVLSSTAVINPYIKSTSKTRYVDAALNRNDEYTNVSNVVINGVERQYGIKREYYFATDAEENENEVPNIKGQVVALTPSTVQTQIYSFKNGPQYMELNGEAMKMQNLLPHYNYSYEYKINGEIPETDSGINVKFIGADGFVSSAVAATGFGGINEIMKNVSTLTANERLKYLENIYSTFYFTATYTETVGGSDEYAKIKKTDKLERISGNAYEATYQIVSTDNVLPYVPYIDIFERRTNMTTVNGSDEEYVSYVKVSSDKIVSTQYETKGATKYVQQFTFTPVSKTKENNEETLYIKHKDADTSGFEYAYIPIQTNITADGTVEYYGLTYVPCKIDIEDNTEAFEIIKESTSYYVKQQYRQILPEEFSSIDNNSLYTYAGNSVIFENPVSSTDYLFDLDISGNTIYVKSNGAVLSFAELKNLYYNANDWYTKNVNKERITNELEKLSLIYNDIQYSLVYEGKWKKIEANADDEYYNVMEKNGDKPLFVKEESFNLVPPRLIGNGYNIEYYEYKIGKIQASEVFKSDDKTYYIDVTKYGYKRIDDRSLVEVDGKYIAEINKFGFAKSTAIEYCKRTPVISEEPTKDKYKFLDKDYWVMKDIQNVTRQTSVLPLSLLSVGRSNIYGGNLYVKIQTTLANEIIDNEYNETIYVKNSNGEYETYYEPKHPAFFLLDGYDSEEQGDSGSYDDEEQSDTSSAEETENDTNLEFYIKVKAYIETTDSSSTYECFGKTLNASSIKFFNSKITHYLLSDEYLSLGELREHEHDKNFFKSKYFYPQFSVNNGIHLSKDGSYYTTISIYDGTRGVISKSLVIQPNIFNVTQYTYDYLVKSFVDIQYSEDLSEVSPNNYNEYYLTYTCMNEQDELVTTYVRLSNESESPAYWQSFIYQYDSDEYNDPLLTNVSYNLLRYKEIRKTAVFDGRTTEFDDHSEVQYFNNFTYEPYIIKKNDTLFGIILTRRPGEDDTIIDSTTKLMAPDPLNPYKYDVVELKEDIYDDIDPNGSTPTIYQDQSVTSSDITAVKPFYISNEKELSFNGTYSWVNPKHGYIFAQVDYSYEPMLVTKNVGYWHRNYDESTLPLKIASYNFYVNRDEISSTNATYMYIPTSYVVSAVIEHPKISYDYIITEKQEIFRYSYLLNGIICNYPSDGIVQENPDGTYTGLINIEANGNRGGLTSGNTLVDLIQTTDISNVSSVKEITHQEEHVSYDLFTYKDALALTNERIPVLYNTEIIPASTHKVQYWNEDSSTYAIKTVVDSYAYKKYNYRYETIPFITASYMYSPEPINVAGLSGLGTAIESSVNAFTGSVSSLVDNISSISSSLETSSNEIKTAINEGSTDLGNYFTSMKNAIVNSLNNLSNDGTQQTTVSGTTEEEPNYTGSYIISYAVDDLAEGLSNSMQNAASIISSKLATLPDGLIQSIDENMTAIKESIEELKPSKMPTYEEFMIDLVPKLYAESDFETDIVETETKDSDGNIITSMKHKPNPIELARKSIYRAEVLWNEMKKKGIIN